MDEKGLGQLLQTARQRAGLTQQQMCQKAHLSYSTLAKIERGAIRSPSIFTIKQIADVLDVSLDDLVGRTRSAPSRKKTKSGVSFVYFDINGCLVRFFHRAFTAISKDTGVMPDIVETAFWQYNDDVCLGKISPKEFNKLFAKRLGVAAIDWQSYYLKAVDPIREMHEVVAWAADVYDVGLLSNIGMGFIDDMKKAKLLPDVAYKAIIDSSEVGVIKPDKAIYEIASDRAGVPASEILLIDDSRANLIPAQELGWHVMWFNDYDAAQSAKRVKEALKSQ